MTTNTGGPAFPGLHPSEECHYKDAGMTLRDYFAGQVAIGAMSEYWNSDRLNDPTFKDIAQHAYAIADAMLEARKL